MKNNKESNFKNIYEEVIAVIFFIIAFIKYVNIYKTMKYGIFSPVYAILTLTIMNGIYYLIKFFSKKKSRIIIISLYVISSIILFVDTVYFSYMNKLTSVAHLKILPFLNAVSESVKEVNPVTYLWIFFDIPIILIYTIFNKRISNYLEEKIKFEINKKNLKIFNFVILIGFITCFMIYGSIVGFKFKYIKSENTIYHICDFLDVVIDYKSDIDYTDYLKVKEKDEKYGIAKNKNVVFIQVEALQNFVINRKYCGQEITPFLNSIIGNDSFYFNNCFYQVGAGNTADAEFAVNNSLISSENEAIYVNYFQNNYYGLPYILKENGYIGAYVFNAHKKDYWNRGKAYVNQGFDKFYAYDDYEQSEIIGLGLSDDKFLQNVAEQMNELQEPFYSFIITLSSHHPFKISEYNNILLKEEHKNTLFGNYLNAINYVDKALEKFFEKLKKNKIYNNSIFVIYGDHFAIPCYNENNSDYISELISHKYSYKDMFNIPFIIHIPGMEKSETIETVAGHVDVLPTVLHLLGIENDKSVMLGNDLFSNKDNIVYLMTHIGKGSYVDNDVFYYTSPLGIDFFNKAFDLKTGKEVQITNEMINTSKKAIKFMDNAKLLISNNKIILNE